MGVPFERFVPVEKWRDGQTAGLPGRWQKRVLAIATEKDTQTAGGEREGNLWLLDEVARIESAFSARTLEGLPPNASDDDICNFAERMAAESMARLTHPQCTAKPKALRTVLERLCHQFGVQPPSEKTLDEPAISRMVDAQWWRNRLRRSHARALEAQAISLGLVHLKAGKYISDESLKRVIDQRRRNLAMLKNTAMVNEETGEIIDLFSIAEKSIANPVIRRGELMVRIGGFEACAKEVGHEALFVTLTCPSRYHAIQAASGARNPRFEDLTPKEAQHYLSAVWACIRAKFARDKIELYGFRIAEPHHDGCPHWHLLLFVAPEQAKAAKAIFHRYGRRDTPNEPGAAKHRVTIKRIDPAKGSAAGYVSKYIAKNVDGFQVDKDLFGQDAVEGSVRVRAWASTWGIRQFQQVGGPPVGVWREMRRIKAEDVPDAVKDISGFHAVPTGLHDAYKAVQKTADKKADFGAFIRAYGGPTRARKRGLIALHKEWDNETGRYLEVKGWMPKGVDVRGGMVDFGGIVGKLWSESCRVVVKRVSAAWEVVRGASEVAAPWTRVNNCTVEPEPVPENNDEWLESFEKNFEDAPFWWSESCEEGVSKQKLEKESGKGWLSGEPLKKWVDEWSAKNDGAGYPLPDFA